MYCPKCTNEDFQVLQETKPMTAGRWIGLILFFPLGLLFLVRGKKTVAVCKKCANKFDI